MSLVSFVIIFSLLIGGIEVAKRGYGLPVNLTRRIAHIGGAFVALAFPFFLSQKESIFIGIIFAGVLFVGRRVALFSSIHNVQRSTLGEVYLPLGIALCAAVFLPGEVRAFQYGVLIMGVSDSFAGLGGERFGKHHIRILGNKKSFEGSAIFFVTSLILTLFFESHFGYSSILIPLILTLSELCLVYGLDNLVLPVLGAYLIQL